MIHPVDRERKRELLSFMVGSQNWRQVLVFTRTKHGANRLSQQLEKDGISSAAIHGNKSQGARTRALADFKRGEVRVLVATDIAARGLDIDQLPHVVNYELPNVPEDYVHRIGRTGRAGNEGQAVSLVCVDEHKLLGDIERLLKRDLSRIVIPGYEPDPSIRAEPIMQRSNARPGGSPGPATVPGNRRGGGRHVRAPRAAGIGESRAIDTGGVRSCGSSERPAKAQSPAGRPLHVCGAASQRLATLASACMALGSSKRTRRDRVAIADHVAVQRSLCGTGFVAFHFDEAKALAFAGEDIGRHADGAYGAEGGKHCAHGFFAGVLRQVADKHLFHVRFLVGAGLMSAGCGKKRTPQSGVLCTDAGLRICQPAAVTLVACRPLGPFSTSKFTDCPSARVLKPPPWIAEKCTNTSALPSDGEINPKPLDSLNHLTVPVVI